MLKRFLYDTVPFLFVLESMTGREQFDYFRDDVGWIYLVVDSAGLRFSKFIRPLPATISSKDSFIYLNF